MLKLRAARDRLRRKGRRVKGRQAYGLRPDECAVLDHVKALGARPVVSV